MFSHRIAILLVMQEKCSLMSLLIISRYFYNRFCCNVLQLNVDQTSTRNYVCIINFLIIILLLLLVGNFDHSTL